MKLNTDQVNKIQELVQELLSSSDLSEFEKKCLNDIDIKLADLLGSIE